MSSPPPEAGLCSDCRHGRTVRSPRSAFVRCDRSDSDPSFPRYPVLPVRSCGGFELIAGGRGTAPDPVR